MKNWSESHLMQTSRNSWCPAFCIPFPPTVFAFWPWQWLIWLGWSLNQAVFWHRKLPLWNYIWQRWVHVAEGFIIWTISMISPIRDTSGILSNLPDEKQSCQFDLRGPLRGSSIIISRNLLLRLFLSRWNQTDQNVMIQISSYSYSFPSCLNIWHPNENEI